MCKAISLLVVHRRLAIVGRSRSGAGGFTIYPDSMSNIVRSTLDNVTASGLAVPCSRCEGLGHNDLSQ
jgi:hypothetical protein